MKADHSGKNLARKYTSQTLMVSLTLVGLTLFVWLVQIVDQLYSVERF